MSSMLGSQGLVLATAMVVSSTVLFLAFSRQKTLFPTQEDQQISQHQTPPRSCLYSDDKKRERKNKKKKVQFAENVKEPSGNGKEFRNHHKKRNRTDQRNCGNEVKGIPQNRIALYSGILKDRVQRIECSY